MGLVTHLNSYSEFYRIRCQKLIDSFIKICASRYKCGTKKCDLCLTEKNDYCSSRPKGSIKQKN